MQHTNQWYVERLGLTGDAAALALKAFEENQSGAARLADRALQRGKNPAGLFLRMVADGDHRIGGSRTSTFTPEMNAVLRELGVADDEEPGPLTLAWARERINGVRPTVDEESEGSTNA